MSSSPDEDHVICFVLIRMFYDLAIFFFFKSFSQMLPATVVIILFVIATIMAEEHHVFFKIEENVFQPDGYPIWEGAADSLMFCSIMCARQAGCSSANFVQSQRACSLFRQEQTPQYAKRLSQQRGSFYLEKVCH